MMNPMRRRNALGGVTVGDIQSGRSRALSPIPGVGPVPMTDGQASSFDVRRTAIRDIERQGQGAMWNTPGLELQDAYRPTYTSNDDAAERRLSPRNYAFGSSQGDYVGNMDGQNYARGYALVPARGEDGRTIGVPTINVLNEIQQADGLLAPEAKWTENAQARDVADQGYIAQGYGGEGWSRYAGDFGPSRDLVASLMAQDAKANPGSAYLQMRQANGGAKNPMLNPGSASLAPSRMFNPQVPSVDVTRQLIESAPLRNYSETQELMPNRYGALVSPPPRPMEMPAEPIGGMSFETMAPTRINSGYTTVDLPSAAYSDIGLSPFKFDPGPRAVNGVESEIGFNGFNNYGSSVSDPFGELIGEIDSVTPRYRRNFAQDQASEWQYNPKGRLMPTPQTAGSGRNQSIDFTQQRRERDRILGKADQLGELEENMGMRPNANLFNYVTRNSQYQDNATTPWQQVEQIQRANRVAESAFNSNLGAASYNTGLPEDVLHREAILRDMESKSPDVALFARAMADQPQDMARVSRRGDLKMMINEQQYPRSPLDQELSRSYKINQELTRRALSGQDMLDEAQRQSMPLPNVEPMRVSILDDGGNFRQQTMPVDYRDMLQARRDLAGQGYGQLQQRLPVGYTAEGNRYPVVNIGPPNMNSYKSSDDYVADQSNGAPFTANNQFHSTGPEGQRVIYGQQTLPITMGVVPGRADDFVPDEAIRIQPAYSYKRPDFQNTAGDRLRGEGYVPPNILTPQELGRRNAGFGYESQWQQRPYAAAAPMREVGIGGPGGGISGGGSGKGEFEVKPTWFEKNDPDAVKLNPMLGMATGFEYPSQAPQPAQFRRLPVQIPWSLQQRQGPNDFSYQAY